MGGSKGGWLRQKPLVSCYIAWFRGNRCPLSVGRWLLTNSAAKCLIPLWLATKPQKEVVGWCLRSQKSCHIHSGSLVSASKHKLVAFLEVTALTSIVNSDVCYGP